jgi:hypothetical protein
MMMKTDLRNKNDKRMEGDIMYISKKKKPVLMRIGLPR